MATWTENTLYLPELLWVQTLDDKYTCYVRRLTGTQGNLRMIDAEDNIILNEMVSLPGGTIGTNLLGDLASWKETCIDKIA